MSKPTVRSPCISLCVIKKNVCIGCGRSLKEIEDWLLLNDEERLKVIDESKKRLEAQKSGEEKKEEGKEVD